MAVFQKSTLTSFAEAASRAQPNSFKLGDRVIFAPSEHTIGWSWSSFGKFRLKPGDIGIITRIDKGMYLYLDDGRGGFHWENFKCTD